MAFSLADSVQMVFNPKDPTRGSSLRLSKVPNVENDAKMDCCKWNVYFMSIAS